jgi:hypothetical protein
MEISNKKNHFFSENSNKLKIIICTSHLVYIEDYLAIRILRLYFDRNFSSLVDLFMNF